MREDFAPFLCSLLQLNKKVPSTDAPWVTNEDIGFVLAGHRSAQKKV